MLTANALCNQIQQRHGGSACGEILHGTNQKDNQDARFPLPPHVELHYRFHRQQEDVHIGRCIEQGLNQKQFLSLDAKRIVKGARFVACEHLCDGDAEERRVVYSAEDHTAVHEFSEGWIHAEYSEVEEADGQLCEQDREDIYERQRTDCLFVEDQP